MRKTILVTGKNGQLGQSLQKIASHYPQYLFTFVGRDQLDFLKAQNITNYFIDKRFDIIINCAAYTAVDRAESEPKIANQVNHLAVKQIAEIAKRQSSILIHISTDYVFDGNTHKPYVETDKNNPINVYGITKLRGEKAIQETDPKGAIIRTSWLYSEFGSNFVKSVLRLGKDRDNLDVIFDQIGSPTYATDLAHALLVLLSHCEGLSPDCRKCCNLTMPKTPDKKRSKVEIYHYSNEGICSWYDFARAILDIAKISCQVTPIETIDYPVSAKRPHFSVMNKAKIKKRLGLVVPHWLHSAKDLVQNLETIVS